MEVEIISTELIKPSSRTPNHLKQYLFSSFDQIIAHVLTPMIFYYKPDSIDPLLKEKLNVLKKSLSHTLTIFYPLAGRVKGNDFVLCNDEGVPFVVARVNSPLSTILQQPNTGELNKLLPFKHDSLTDLAAAVQINLFSCGGVSIGFGMSHKLGDAYSMLMFLNAWASISRGETNKTTPLFNAFDLFPPRNISSLDPNAEVAKEDLVTKMFAFDASNLLALQNKYTNDGEVISQVQALTAFIWCRYMETIETDKEDVNKIYVVVHVVNLRPKMELPNAKDLFGNMFGGAVALAKMDSDDGNYGIVRSMRDAIRNVNEEFVKKNEMINSEQLDLTKEMPTSGDICSFYFSSWSKFPIYQVNFRWGNPVWVSSATSVIKNGVIFCDNKNGDGIEAWVSLKVQDMIKFEKDKDLLAYVSPSSKS